MGGGDWIGYWIAKATIQMGSYFEISFRRELAQIQLVVIGPTLLVALSLLHLWIRESSCTWAREPVFLVPSSVCIATYR